MLVLIHVRHVCLEMSFLMAFHNLPIIALFSTILERLLRLLRPLTIATLEYPTIETVRRLNCLISHTLLLLSSHGDSEIYSRLLIVLRGIILRPMITTIGVLTVKTWIRMIMSLKMKTEMLLLLLMMMMTI